MISLPQEGCLLRVLTRLLPPFHRRQVPITAASRAMSQLTNPYVGVCVLYARLPRVLGAPVPHDLSFGGAPRLLRPRCLFNFEPLPASLSLRHALVCDMVLEIAGDDHPGQREGSRGLSLEFNHGLYVPCRHSLSENTQRTCATSTNTQARVGESMRSKFE